MSRVRLVLSLLLLCCPALLLGQAAGGKAVYVLAIDGPIGPATSDYFRRGLLKAREAGAELVVLRMDTPGGLDSAMREIIQEIIASPVPVAGFVAPSGSRAASAGTYILYASHVAAMAPATTLGAATPVQIGTAPEAPRPPTLPGPGNGEQPDKEGDAQPAPGGTSMERKMVNDAAAYIRGLAQMRGRNAEWAERAVREAASLPAAEALDNGVIDLIASDIGDLLQQLHGRSVNVLGTARTLDTRAARVVTIEPDWRSRLLSVITDPNILPILMTLGMFGLLYELLNPGFVLPGVLGAICLLLALYAAQVLPVSFAGLALILVGVAFMVAEAFIPSFGALGIGGVIAFIIGSVILIDTEVEGYGVSLPVIISFGILNGLLFVGVLTLAVKARRRPVVSGREQLVGMSGEALSAFAGRGRVHVHGEDWQALTKVPLKRGQKVRVTAVDGLTLTVEPSSQEVEQ